MSAKKTILSGERIAVAQNSGGDFAVSCGPFVFRHILPTVFLQGQEHPIASWQVIRHTPAEAVFSAANDCGKWTLVFILDAAKGLTLQLSGKLKRACNEIELRYFGGVGLPADHLLSQGIKMGGCRSLLLNSAVRREFEGHYQLLLRRGNASLRLSYPLQSKFLASFCGTTGRNRVSELRAGATIRNYSGRELELPPLNFRQGDGIELMLDYAEENRTPGKEFRDMTSPGWNSWDYYRWTVTEDAVLENAEFIAADPVLSQHVKRIIVDDGWQYAYGEWEANSLFPHGMAYLANRIRKLGMEPGLWVAPTILDLHSRIAQLHPEMLAKSPGGIPAPCWEIMKRRVFLLDVTMESSQKYIRDLLEKMLGWGYTYFKLDFLGSLLSARSFFDRSITPGKLMALSIGTAYRQVAGRAKLLGCNYLFNGGPDMADIVRVGSDIHARWKNIRQNAVSVAARFWCNKKLWINDPDFALCRSQDTADDPEMQRLRPSIVFADPDSPEDSSPLYDFSLVGDDVFRPQMEVLLSIVLMAGGAVNLSDRMCKLNDSGLDLARRIVAAESGETAVPLDLFKSEIPAFWLQKLRHGCRVLIVNWKEEDDEFVFDLDRHGISCRKAVDFWNGHKFCLHDGKLKSVLSPHTCLLAEFK